MNCPACQRPLPANAPGGLCPECLMRGGLGTHAKIDPASTADDVGRRNPRFVPPAVEQLADVFPQLEVLEFIGQGGMGAVYKARQKQLDRVVALKILPPDIGEDAAFAERFAREAKAMAKLSHPGIVTIHDFGRTDGAGGLFYFVMEFVDGVNLGELSRQQQVSPKEALQIVPKICDALQYAHDQGIVHRDIKPENILLDRQGRVKVADFGLAKLMGSVEEPTGEQGGAVSGSLTEAERVMGTPQYMAPEQRDHPLDVDHRADVYSLGVVFYQLLTGEFPQSPIEPPSQRVQVDVRLDEVVLKALEEKPERRYQQVSVMKTRVETIAGTPPLESPGRESSSPQSESAATSPRRVLWLIWFIAAILVVMAVSGDPSAFPKDPVTAVCLLAIALVVLRFFFPPTPRDGKSAAYRVLLPILVVGIGVVIFTLWLVASSEVLSTSEQETWVTLPEKLPSNRTANPVTELMLQNSGMEKGNVVPTGWEQGAAVPGVEYIWVQPEGYSTEASLCLHKTLDRYFPIADWSQTVPREGDSPVLQVTTRVKADEVTKAIVDVIFFDDQRGWISHEWVSYIGAENSEDTPVTHDWKEYSGQVAIPEEAGYIQIALQIYGPGKVWFDDVQANYVE